MIVTQNELDQFRITNPIISHGGPPLPIKTHAMQELKHQTIILHS